LYLLRPEDLDATAPLEVRDLLGPLLGGAVRPHGVDVRLLRDGGVRVAVVNRAYVRDPANGWRQRPELDVIDIPPNGEAQIATRILSSRLCSANDVALQTPERMTVSLDRGVCVEDGRQPIGGPALAMATAEGAVRSAPAPTAFPNGLASAQGQVWVAGTLDRALSVAEGGRRVAMPGAPDNLTIDPQGRLVAALHPQLWRFAPHRYGWPLFDRAPSRIVRFDPAAGTLATLFDDPDGRFFSGATVAAVVGDRLVLGAVREPGLLVCPLATSGSRA